VPTTATAAVDTTFPYPGAAIDTLYCRVKGAASSGRPTRMPRRTERAPERRCREHNDVTRLRRLHTQSSVYNDVPNEAVDPGGHGSAGGCFGKHLDRAPDVLTRNCAGTGAAPVLLGPVVAPSRARKHTCRRADHATILHELSRPHCWWQPVSVAVADEERLLWRNVVEQRCAKVGVFWQPVNVTGSAGL
jgi:hypothetical protein